MKDWQRRVVYEHDDLCKKISKLTDFICTEKFDTLDIIDQTWLVRQRDAMDDYLLILIERIRRF